MFYFILLIENCGSSQRCVPYCFNRLVMKIITRFKKLSEMILFKIGNKNFTYHTRLSMVISYFTIFTTNYAMLYVLIDKLRYALFR